MSNKSLEDNILTELEQLKGLAARFKAAEDAYQKASSRQEQVIDLEALTNKLEETILLELVKTKEELHKEQTHWAENLESRLHQIIKGIEHKFATEGVPFENRQELIQLKVKQEQDSQRIQQENEQLHKQIAHLEAQTRRNFNLFVALLALLTLIAVGIGVFWLFTA